MTSVIRYTRTVGRVKRSLWMLVAAIVGVIIWVASDNTGENGSRIVFSHTSSSGEAGDGGTMVKPYFQGVDAKDQPYTVIADTATQKDADTVLMKNVRADMQQKRDTWLALASGDGEMNLKEKKMYLSGKVSVFYDGGYEFRSDHVRVDIRQGSAYGDSRIEGQGPMGTLVADRFEALERGQVLHFNGSVKVVIYR